MEMHRLMIVTTITRKYQMSKSKSAGRKLDPYRVRIAQKVERTKHELAMQMVADRVKTDPEFAADVLKIGGTNLREDIKKSAQETITKASGIKLETDPTLPSAVKLAIEASQSFPDEIIQESVGNQ